MRKAAAKPARDRGQTTALVAATVLALVPWVGLAADAASGGDAGDGRPTTATCETAWCFPSLRHVVISATIGWAAACAGIAVAVALVVLVRRGAVAWPAAVIVLAAAAMALYAVYA